MGVERWSRASSVQRRAFSVKRWYEALSVEREASVDARARSKHEASVDARARSKREASIGVEHGVWAALRAALHNVEHYVDIGVKLKCQVLVSRGAKRWRPGVWAAVCFDVCRQA